MMRKLTFAILLSSAMTAGALAQTAWVEIDDDVVVAPFSQNVDAVDDWDVWGADGKIGEVEEVLGAEAGTATALAVDFEDDSGFGQDDDDEVIVPLDQFTFADDRLTLNADAAAVAGMERYDD